MKAWGNSVLFEGWASREKVDEILSEVCAGMVVLLPLAHVKLALPIKLFEYMAAELPVISSDFPLWRAIIEGAGCGVLVDPLDATSIAAGMVWILDHPKEAAEMGRRGRAAVEREYNWDPEASRLTDFYRNKLGVSTRPPR
jgi:glycosyltransferase involved in cell wall biosynthesis